MPIFELTLEKTYYGKGFFNVKVGFDPFVRQTEGPVELRLGRTGVVVQGKIDRRANQNGTARIMGGAKLRDWFQANFRQGDTVNIDLRSLDAIRIG
jgi:hypothetical protein